MVRRSSIPLRSLVLLASCAVVPSAAHAQEQPLPQPILPQPVQLQPMQLQPMPAQPPPGVQVSVRVDQRATLFRDGQPVCESPCGGVVPPGGAFWLGLSHAPHVRTDPFALPQGGSVTLDFASNSPKRATGVGLLVPGIVFLVLGPVWALSGLASIQGSASGDGAMVGLVGGAIHFGIGLPLTIAGGVLVRAKPSVFVGGARLALRGPGVEMIW